MEQTHLMIQDIMKYLDTADLSEEYLLWMDQAADHLAACPKCQEALQKAMNAEYICEADGFDRVAALTPYEGKIRKDIIICKLLQMQQNERMEAVVHLLRNTAVLPYVLQLSECQRGMGISRGNDHSDHLDHSEKAEFINRDGQLVVRIPGTLPDQKRTVVLERNGEEPVIQEAVWDEETKSLTAQFPMADPDEEVELYVL